ncbi:MAG TPA: ABC transporter permease subunit [Opitutales bacterium]|jgi:NitT/TauT family transport system permease protein|nr:ABC transporter permease subunit [Opitutales bacterium]
MNSSTRKISFWKPPLCAGVVILALWYAAIAVFHIPKYLLPAPHEILQALIREGSILFLAALHTGGSALLGFIAAVVGGGVIALALASSRWIKAALYPWILVLQMVPVVVMVPIFVMWWGAGRPSITAIAFIISFFPVVASTTLGLVSTDRGLLELFTVLQAGKAQEIFLLRLPFALPYFLTGVKIAATLAPVGAIFGEFSAGTSPDSLGYLLLIYSRDPSKMPEVFAVACVSYLLGILFVGAVQLLSWLALRHWHESARAVE